MTLEERAKIIQEQIEFAQADTVCFLAPYPMDLKKQQQEKWQPVIDWINAKGCDFTASCHLTVNSLSDRTKSFLKTRLQKLNDTALEAFCLMSGGCKSVILALSVLEGFLTPEQAFDLSVLEETFQNRFWSEDEEALIARKNRKEAVVKAFQMLKG